ARARQGRRRQRAEVRCRGPVAGLAVMNVDLSILRREALRVRLALGRIGTGALIAGALLSGAAVLWAVVLPSLSVRVEEQSREVAQARAAPLPKPVVSAPALASQRLDAFYAALGDGAHTEQ